ncbi:MAG: crosslink repair DNA glycosylase YcaQ family protein, partial [Thermoanaerobaculia bacterium]|nr:crosslink repair DNA glycosylase YcaQ family protein [Thermoanaerobaculia bacterium]
STLARTWDLRNVRDDIRGALAELEEEGRIVACRLVGPARPQAGWIRPADLDLADRLASARPRADRGVLLSPFDPLLWDRDRVDLLFGFHQVLEIFKPEGDRVYGYFCLPVLAGERLVARVDLKAHRSDGRIEVRCCHLEPEHADAAEATRSALERYSRAVGMEVDDGGRLPLS